MKELNDADAQEDLGKLMQNIVELGRKVEKAKK